MYFLMFFVRIPAKMPLCGPPPLVLGFTAITDPRAVELLRDCGPQSGAAPGNVPVSFQSLATQSAGSGRFSDRHALLLFLSVLLLLHHSGQISKTAALYYICICQIQEKRGRN
jgi:hypothetical protein